MGYPHYNLQLQYITYWSSHQMCSVRKSVLRNFAKITGKRLYQGLLFNKVAALRPATLLKKRHWDRCLPVNFAKFLRTSFLQNNSGRQLGGLWRSTASMRFAEHRLKRFFKFIHWYNMYFKLRCIKTLCFWQIMIIYSSYDYTVFLQFFPLFF